MTDPAFSTQLSLLAAVSEVLVPDMVIREDQLPLALEQLGQQAGLSEIPEPPAPDPAFEERLARIYDAEVEAAVRAVYNRDFMAFGYRRWQS